MDYNMSGPAIGASVVNGMKAGIADSTQTLQVTLSSSAMSEIAIMFIGIAVVVSIVSWTIRHKNETNSSWDDSSSGGGDGGPSYGTRIRRRKDTFARYTIR
jgi:hypothetical protein